MADVFISYATEFIDLSAKLAAALEKAGYSVWWDRSLVGGDSYRHVIVREIRDSRATVVLWTPAAIESDWVYSEASRGYRQKKLVPVKTADLELDDIPPPFDALHILDAQNHAGIRAAIDRLVAGNQDKRQAQSRPAKDRNFGMGWLSWIGHMLGSFSVGTILRSPPVILEQRTMGASADDHTRGWRKIFLSYRRPDGAVADRIHQALDQHFKRSISFRDVASIPPGVDFRQVIMEQLQESDAVLVLIGPEWATRGAANGQRQIDNPDDFVAMEIAFALSTERPIIPVLLDGAKMPAPDQLPVAIKALALRNAFSVRSTNFDADMARLFQTFQAWREDD